MQYWEILEMLQKQKDTQQQYEAAYLRQDKTARTHGRGLTVDGWQTAKVIYYK